ncbi:class I SAM-dependent methyltransferase [Neorhizobium tomejilense]
MPYSEQGNNVSSKVSFSRLLRSIAEEISDIRFLLRSGSGLKIVLKYMKFRRMRRSIEKKYKPATKAFVASEVKGLQLSNDWFVGHLPIWMWLFDRFDLRSRADLKALEIGSWEGMSAFFFLKTLPNATLTCVDTWAGSDEHDKEAMSAVEGRFNANLVGHAGRMTKFKGTSNAYFMEKPKDLAFDFIYVDGSHLADDVMMDAVNGFAALKPGGIMVFDDYIWGYYADANDNPANAVHRFLEMKRGKFELVYLFQQVIIRKTSV